MKQHLYLLICLFCLSCANENKRANSEARDYDRVEEADVLTNKDSKTINFETLATQKLVDYFDLIQLLEAHPEFKNDILLELNSLSAENIEKTNYSQLDYIKNIRQVGNVHKVSDSVQNITLYFDIIANKSIKTDSILAIFTTKKIRIDGDSTISTKVRFRGIGNLKQVF